MSETAVESHRERIVREAARLLADGGRDAVSTRAVAAAAGVQAPTLYRLFGDKQGLLDAVAAHGFETYLRTKADRPPAADPVDDLRAGWDLHVGLGLADPALYCLMYADPRPGAAPPAARAAYDVLAAKIHRIAEAGRLRVPELRAARLVHAAGSGVTLTLIGLPEDDRDPDLSTAAREAVIAALTTDAPPGPAGPPGAAAAAVTLRAALPHAEGLTAPERTLLQEWLDRIAASNP